MTQELTLRRPHREAAAQQRAHPLARRRAEPLPPEPADDDLQRTAASLALAAVEVLHGLRALRAIARWFEPALLERIRVSAELRAELNRTQAPQHLGFAPGRPRICRISEDIVEACVVIRTRRRHRAVALRLETHRGRWIVTQLLTL